MRRLAGSLLLVLAAPASAEPGRTVDVALSSFKFTPADIRLHHGDPYALRLTNAGSGGHDFVAPDFFTAARVDPADAGLVHKGGIDVDGGQTVTVHLTAPTKPGRYKVHCSHFLHSTFGMTGTIIVD